MIDPDKLLASAQRVQAAVREDERQAALRAAHPQAKHPEEAARWELRERRRLLDEMAATLPALDEEAPDAA